MGRSRKFLSVLVVIVVLSSCSGEAKRPPPVTEIAPEYEYGEAAPPDQFDVAESSVSSGSHSMVDLKIEDQNGLGARQVPVRLRGPVELLLYSDDGGKVQVEIPAGKYLAEIGVGCTDKLLVESGASRIFTVQAGHKLSGLIKVAWKHRITPAFGAYPNRAPTWYLGQPIVIEYDVYDRCEDDRAKNSSFPSWKFRKSTNLELIGTPKMLSDERAKATITVRCIVAGQPSIVAFDSLNLSDEFDLIRFILLQGEIRCGEQR